MKTKKQKLFRLYLRFSAYALLIAAFNPLSLSAQTISDPVSTNYGLNSEFAEVGISTNQDLKSIIALVINIVLGFLGVIAVIIIIVAGFKWMTAAGNQEQVASARKMLVEAVVGLAIIFLSWSIASFVISRIGDATGAGQRQNQSNGSGAARTGSETSENSLGEASPNSNQEALPRSGGSASLPVLTGPQTPDAASDNLDSDGDGLTDREETDVFGTNPLNSDTDGDGYPDGSEAEQGYDPKGADTLLEADSCGYLFPELASAFNSPQKLQEISERITQCCAASNSPLCAGI